MICGVLKDAMFLESLEAETKLRNFRCPQKSCQQSLKILADALWPRPALGAVEGVKLKIGVSTCIFLSFFWAGAPRHKYSSAQVVAKYKLK